MSLGGRLFHVGHVVWPDERSVRGHWYLSSIRIGYCRYLLEGLWPSALWIVSVGSLIPFVYRSWSMSMPARRLMAKHVTMKWLGLARIGLLKNLMLSQSVGEMLSLLTSGQLNGEANCMLVALSPLVVLESAISFYQGLNSLSKRCISARMVYQSWRSYPLHDGLPQCTIGNSMVAPINMASAWSDVLHQALWSSQLRPCIFDWWSCCLAMDHSCYCKSHVSDLIIFFINKYLC